MLRLVLPEIELFDSNTQEFIVIPSRHLTLEHSLISISKWESKWCKPFISDSPKSVQETLDYVLCMDVTNNLDETILSRITDEHLLLVKSYIDAPTTATTIRSEKSYGYREVITSEIIYYWMISLNIPFECQKWHLNRLLTLVNVCNIKNAPPKKMNKKDLMSRNRALNESRKKAHGTSG